MNEVSIPMIQDVAGVQTFDFEELEKEYAEASRSKSTRRAYENDWKVFTEFCNAAGLVAMPATPDTIVKYVLYLHAVKKRKISTIQRYLSSVSVAHKSADLPSPTQTKKVQVVIDGLKKTHGVAPQPKEAAVADKIQIMIDKIPDNNLGVRDRALLLLGFTGAFRRSELVSLNLDDIQETKEGLRIILRRSKTDQEGRGMEKAIPYAPHWEVCPVRAWKAWQGLLNQHGITEGPAFRALDRHGNILRERQTKSGKVYGDRLSDKAVALVVKRYAEAAGLDPNQYAGHSLRSGFATTASENGATDLEIMWQTGHRSRVMVDRYVRRGNLFKRNAATKLWVR